MPGPKVLLVNTEFMPMLAEIAPTSLETVQRFVFIEDVPGRRRCPDGFAGEYEALVGAGVARPLTFPDFDENTRATTFYTTGTTGLPKGRLLQPPAARVAHPRHPAAALGSAPASQGRLHRDDVYMPITPMFHVHAWGLPFVATMLGLQARSTRAATYARNPAGKLVRERGASPSPIACPPSCTCCWCNPAHPRSSTLYGAGRSSSAARRCPKGLRPRAALDARHRRCSPATACRKPAPSSPSPRSSATAALADGPEELAALRTKHRPARSRWWTCAS
jgi:acyl-CoA synthetase (AMP-forming)/AMP-acid ligase II